MRIVRPRTNKPTVRGKAVRGRAWHLPLVSLETSGMAIRDQERECFWRESGAVATGIHVSTHVRIWPRATSHATSAPANRNMPILVDRIAPRLLGNTKQPRRRIQAALRRLRLLGSCSRRLLALAQEPISNLPRNQTLIVENPEGTIKNAGWFNIWAINAGGQSTGLHQLAMDTFWYIDPQRGLDGVWMNSLASDKPIYNADFTEMTVKLRPGIFWSDGVEFTRPTWSSRRVAHDDQRHAWSAPFQINVASCRPDRNTRVQAEKAEFALQHLHGALEAVWMIKTSSRRSPILNSTSTSRSRSGLRCTVTTRTANGHMANARRWSARHSAALASRARNTSRTWTRARPTSA